MSDPHSALSNPVRPFVIAKYSGQLMLALAVLNLPPLVCALLNQEWEFGSRILTVLLICLGGFLLSTRIAEPKNIQNNEALVIISSIFIMTALFMTFPLISAGLKPLDAFFESVSAITTTGLSTVRNLSEKPRSFLFTRAWMQWYGGLGFVVFSVAMMAHHHIAARRLIQPEQDGSLMTSARFHARQILLVYLGITGVGLIILRPLLSDGFSAAQHVFAAVSTGGFSPFDNSLEGLQSTGGRLAVVGIALIGAIPLPLLYYWYDKKQTRLGPDTEFIAYLFALTLTCGALFLAFDAESDNLPQAFENAILMGISAQSTAGFSSMDLEHAPAVAIFILILSMFIGGCVGSTAGGAKILRVLICARHLQHALLLTALPNRAVVKPRIGDRDLHQDESIRALLLLALFAGVIAISWPIFIAFGYPPLNSLFEVCSATATAGLSSGITKTALEPELKLLLCLDMLLGRLEIIALLVLCYPRTWIGRGESS